MPRFSGILPKRVTSRTGLTFLLPAVALVIGCATAPKPVPLEPGTPVGDPFSIPDQALGTQRLLRVHYHGPEGSGSLRLVLRLQEVNEFHLLAADRLGRALWSLEVAPTRVGLVNHRDRWFCEANDAVVLPEKALALLPLTALPRVLLGYVPVLPSGSPDPGLQEFTGPEGGRWTVTWIEGLTESWTQWKESRPTLWWTRRPKGGILSHRDGIQFRWREVVNEPLAEDLEALSVPAEYRRVSCNESDFSQLRQDQPPP